MSNEKASALSHLRLTALRSEASSAGRTSELAEATAAAIEELAEGTVYYADTTCLDITIPASAWAENTDETWLALGLLYCADVEAAELTAADLPETFLSAASQKTARDCGLYGQAQAMDGAVRYYAVKAPAADISAQLRVIRAITTQGGTV